MHSIIWLLLFAPPVLSGVAWLMTRGWTAMMMRGRSTPRIVLWQKYDYLVLLTISFFAMLVTALIEHKL